MFCPATLAATIDLAEGRFCAAIAEQSREGRHGAGVLVTSLGDGMAVFATADSPINKIIGAGFAHAPTDDELSRVEAHFARHGARLQAEIATLAAPDMHRRLVARGYEPFGFEHVLGQALDEVAEAPPDVAVTRAEGPEMGRLAEILADAFTVPDHTGIGLDQLPSHEVMCRWFAASSKVQGYRAYAARVDGVLAGAAALRVDGLIAQFAGAGTIPMFRRRGVQRALLRARLRDAAAAGCRVGVVVTQPASQSQHNVQREGFGLLYARQLLVKRPPATD